jgi:hypothetical protein
MRTHAASVVASQRQREPVVTAISLVPLESAMVTEVGDTVT